MKSLIEELSRALPEVTFTAGKTFHWSPRDKTITYRETASPSDYDSWALMHEAGHALLKHQAYNSDFELLLLEVAAWQEALKISSTLGSQIDQDHIEDCLDTYRDWLHQRSTCPACSISSLQVSSDQYRCYNCNMEWHVTPSRFCRAYRRRKLTDKQKRPQELPLATFM